MYKRQDDPAAVGVLLHEVLKTFYAPAVGKTVRPDPHKGDASLPALDEKVLRALFREAFEASGLPASLPPESAAMLSVAGPERLARFLQAQPCLLYTSTSACSPSSPGPC